MREEDDFKSYPVKLTTLVYTRSHFFTCHIKRDI